MSCPFRSSSSDKVKLSPFVSTPAVARLLSARAPDLSFSKVQTLAQILSAPCPTELEIEASIEGSGIPSRLDDQISDKDPSDKEEARDGLGSSHAGSEFQVNGAGRFNGGTPQFQSAKSWSNAGTTEDRIRNKTTTADRIGFRTANNHFSELRKQGDIACEADKVVGERRVAHDKMVRSNAAVVTGAKRASALTPTAGPADVSRPSAQPIKTNGASKSTTRPAGQRTLMGFLAKPPPEAVPSARLNKPKTATEVVETTNGLDITLKEQIGFLPAPIIPKRAGKDFILLSSSPPRRIKKVKVDPGQHEPCKKMSHVEDAQVSPLRGDLNEQDDIACEPPSSPVFNAFCQAVDGGNHPSMAETIDGACCELDEGFLPEPTRATEAPLANSGPGVSAPANPGRKRTLGIRRSLNGWQNRGSKRV